MTYKKKKRVDLMRNVNEKLFIIENIVMSCVEFGLFWKVLIVYLVITIKIVSFPVQNNSNIAQFCPHTMH